MKAITFLIAMAFTANASACVTYNSGKGTYTIDQYGSVDNNSMKRKDSKPPKSSYEESGASRDRTDMCKEKKDKKIKKNKKHRS